MAQYQVVGAGSYMENHAPAQVLTGGGPLASFSTSDNSFVLLSIGSDGTLRVCFKHEHASTSWSSLDLAAPGGSKAAANQVLARVTSDTDLCLYVTFCTGPNGSEELFCCQSLSRASDATWLTVAGEVSWTKLEFDTSDPSINPNSLSFAELIDAVDPVSGTKPILLAVLTASDGGSVVPFFVSPEGLADSKNWLAASSNAGSVMKVPASFTAAKMYDKQEDGYKEGCLRCYEAADGKHRYLEFLPYQKLYGRLDPFAVDLTSTMQNPTAVAALPPPAGEQASLVFAADQTAINLVSIDGDTISVKPVVSLPSNAKFSDLHAVSNPAGDVVLFGTVQQNDAKSVYSTTFRKDSQKAIDSPEGWSLLLPIYRNIQQMVAIEGDEKSDVGLIVVHAPGASKLAKSLNADDTTCDVAHIWREATTKTWRNEVLGTPVTGDCVVLQTFTTRLKVMDGQTGLPLQTGDPSGLPPKVMLSASIPSDVIVNGTSYNFTANDPQEVSLDSTSTLNIVHAVSGLHAAKWTVMPVDGEGALLAESGQVIDPSTEAVSKMGVSAKNKFAGATYPAKVAPQPKKYSPPPRKNLVANTTFLPQAATATGQLTNWIQTNAKPTSNDNVGSDGGLDDWLLSELGDLVQAVVHGAEEAVETFLHVVDETVHLVVTFAEAQIAAVITDVEDALHAIIAVLKQIVEDVEAVFRWLAFLFDWGKIVDVHQKLSAMYTEASNDIVTGLKDTEVAKQITSKINGKIAGGLVADNANTVTGLAGGKASGQEMWMGQKPAPTPIGANGQSPDTEPKMGWVSSHLSQPSAAKAVPKVSSGGRPAALSDDDPFASVITSLVTNSETMLSRIGDDIESVWDGKTSPEKFLGNVFNDLVTGVKADATDLVDVLPSTIIALEEGSSATLGAEIDIPVISALYEDAADAPLTLLDLGCLCQAVLLVIGYELLTATEDNPPDVTDAVASLQSTVNGGIKTWLGLPQATLSTASEDDASRLDEINGLLLVSQALVDTTSLGVKLAEAQAGEGGDTELSPTLPAICLAIGLSSQLIDVGRSFADQSRSGANTLLPTMSLIASIGFSWAFFSAYKPEDTAYRNHVSTAKAVFALIKVFIEIIEAVAESETIEPNEILIMIYHGTDLLADELVEHGKGLFELVGLFILLRAIVYGAAGVRIAEGDE